MSGQASEVTVLARDDQRQLPRDDQRQHPRNTTTAAPPPKLSHLAIMEEGSKAELVISATDSCSWYAFSAEITGA